MEEGDLPIFVSEDVGEHFRVRELLANLRSKNVTVIGRNKRPVIGLLLAKNRGRFLKPCPGQKGNICCGYWVVEWGIGCPFACEYCILQVYVPPGLQIWYVNWEDLAREIDTLRKNTCGRLRIGTGEYGDSLAMERQIPLNYYIVKHLQDWEGTFLEIKTKSDNVASLEHWPDKSRVIVAFSVNPIEFIRQFEHETASLHKRFEAAKKVADWGFRLAFHFDPIFPVTGWRDAYSELIRLTVQEFAGIEICWFSLGIFRFPSNFSEIVLATYPESSLFFEEHYPCVDGKMRMFRPLREEVYTFVRELLKQGFPRVQSYLCMESADVWERLGEKSLHSSELKKRLDGIL